MNKDLFFEGKEYISASRASKKLGYAQDYIGELARSKKIAGKLIGRTWYVELDSLLEHKKNRKAKKQRFTPEAPVAVVSRIPSRNPLVYKLESSRALPSLQKSKPALSHYEKLVANLVTISISIIIVLNVAAAWVAYLSPSVADNVNIKIADVSDATAQSLTASAINAEGFTTFVWNGIENKFLALFGKTPVQNISDESAAPASAQGIVAIPDNARHADDVANIRNNFSDPVGVTFDQSGQSGVITPDFRDPSTTENYTFVLVPVTKNQ